MASVRDVWALVTWVWAEAMLAWSEAIWAAEAPSAWSVASWAWSLARVAWAWASAAASEVSSMVARAWPTVTVCPARDVHGGDPAGHAEVEVGLVGRLDGARRRHRLGDGPGRDGLDRGGRGDQRRGARAGGGQPDAHPGAHGHDDHGADDRPLLREPLLASGCHVRLACCRNFVSALETRPATSPRPAAPRTGWRRPSNRPNIYARPQPPVRFLRTMQARKSSSAE